MVFESIDAKNIAPALPEFTGRTEAKGSSQPTLPMPTLYKPRPASRTLLVPLVLTGCLLNFHESYAQSLATLATTVVDVDGNRYATVEIGGQTWMAENLKTTKYNDGTPILAGLDNAAWGAALKGAMASYNDNLGSVEPYGYLYNWAAVTSERLAPAGWHIPNQAEWNSLINALGGTGNAGGKLKATSKYWEAPNTRADNSSGFGAMPGGTRTNSGLYASAGTIGYFWTATERNTTQGNYLKVNNLMGSVATNGAVKKFGMAVRCVKNRP